MKFAIFYEHQLPRDWGPDSESKLLKDSLEQIELADHPGFDYAWEVEHHFLEDYIDTEAFNFTARGTPRKPSSKAVRNLISGVAGRPGAQTVA